MMGAMDHNEVRELLEDAAVEPGGLERLMAGDTPNAALVAGHLAGCAGMRGRARAAAADRRRDPAGGPGRAAARAARADARLRGGPGSPARAAPSRRGRLDGRAGRAVRTVDSDRRRVGRSTAPASRGRRARPLARAGRRAASSPSSGRASSINAGRDARRARPGRGDRGARRRRPLDARGRPPAGRRAGRARRARPASRPTGTLLYSPSTSGLVVVADELAPPPAGQGVPLLGRGRRPARPDRARCSSAGDLAYWVGDVPEVSRSRRRRHVRRVARSISRRRGARPAGPRPASAERRQTGGRPRRSGRPAWPARGMTLGERRPPLDGGRTAGSGSRPVGVLRRRDRRPSAVARSRAPCPAAAPPDRRRGGREPLRRPRRRRVRPARRSCLGDPARLARPLPGRRRRPRAVSCRRGPARSARRRSPGRRSAATS